MYAFEIERPTELSAAVAALKDEGAQALGGGQTLIPSLKQRLAMPEKLVSLSAIDEIKGVTREGDALVVGGGATHGEIAAAAEEAGFRGLAMMARQIGDPAVRNRGTMGGSLANNDPSACYPSMALATGATIVTDRREIAAADFFQGLFATALEEGEIIVRIRIPVPAASSYQKFAQPASRFPLVGVFVARTGEGARVAVTGAGEDGVFRWSEAEEALSAGWSAEAVAGLSHPSEGLISDLHGTPAYRAHLIGVMTRRGVADAA
ncbi:FAD binding domain-containing protein [Wenxinia saemankumensis]|uniref:Carbon-monoxide dehydrogenase medium subunit n=1 Tax=Wenxinia saemankumensis TaxID=1447782 RepID=A0A1M6AAR4_9RHOB|nr:FAD binding domain-containing protein [Wenxinia saemankumensis]SHI33540.1 carbon-monoxide dehydrogenase medium subunit [Wenxinia saemankumensis]